jgi:hypothetical protein
MMRSVKVMEREKGMEVMRRGTSCRRTGTLSSPSSSRLLTQDRPRNVTVIISLINYDTE